MSRKKEYSDTSFGERSGKTILQVVPALVSGGVERGTIEIAQKLVDLGYNSIVVSAGGPLVSRLEKIGAKHVQMNVASKNPFTIWSNTKLIADLIREHEIDLVHARSRAPAWSASMATKATGKKFVTTFHGIYNFSGYIKKYYNSIMCEGERVIAVSNFVKRHIIENYNVDENKISVIHRGVDYKYFDHDRITPDILSKFLEKYHVPNKVPVILLPSRMTNWKGQLILVEALEKIKNKDFFCIMVGDSSRHPNYTKRVQQLISEYRLQSKVQIFGNESDMLGLYGIADIVLSTSTEPEAFGRTIIEGQAMGKIVISTNIGGAAETIIDQLTGFHVKPGDSGELAAKISYCLSILGGQKADDITSMARKSAVENFSLDQMLEKTMEVYKELI